MNKLTLETVAVSDMWGALAGTPNLAAWKVHRGACAPQLTPTSFCLVPSFGQSFLFHVLI